jgi:hypothetical protein
MWDDGTQFSSCDPARHMELPGTASESAESRECYVAFYDTELNGTWRYLRENCSSSMPASVCYGGYSIMQSSLIQYFNVLLFENVVILR